MKTSHYMGKTVRFLGILILGAAILTAGTSQAQENENSAQEIEPQEGFFLGINVGGGGTSVSYHEPSRTIIEDPSCGVMGGLRFGYAFSSKFSLSLEGLGFAIIEDDEEGIEEDPGVGAGLMVATWRPVGGGFFVRAGVGGGGGNFMHPESGEMITIKGRAAGLFGLGYDWRVGKNFSLGLTADTMILGAEGITDFEDEMLNASGLTVQLNWHL